MKVHGKVALVTGAGSGIGGALAYALAQRGCNLALVDIDTNGLQQTHEQLKAFAVKTSTHVLDVTDSAAIAALTEILERLHGGIDLLVNNAGIAAGGTFQQVSEATFDRVLAVNFHAMVKLTRTFLPALLQRPAAHIVYISSLYGLVSPEGQTAYSASKFAIRGFANALRHELDNTAVKVSVVHPGGVATNIARNAAVPAAATAAQVQKAIAEGEKFLRLPASKAANTIVNGIEKDKPRILVGADARCIALLERIYPIGYWAIMKQIAKYMAR